MSVSTTSKAGRAAAEGLVRAFASNASYYTRPEFNETAARNQFIDPLFKALGWDVDDDQRLAARRDVVVENRHTTAPTAAGDDSWDDDLTDEELDARVATSTFPDYVFRVDARDVFVTEAKKPSVSLRGRRPTYQAKSYAWSKQLVVAVLTDFEELRVFDARFRPEVDRPQAGVVGALDLTYGRYLDEWDVMWGLLSREAVVGGSLDRFARENPARGAVPVGKAFFAELAGWRATIAEDLLRRNPTLEGAEIAEATQRILDRVVFIRAMEDRNILDRLVLRPHARTTDSYRSMRRVFRQLDTVYNGQLFSDHFSERLDLSDSVFQGLVAKLYFPEPYRFNVIGTDLLGSVYEQFLGQAITIGDDGAVHVDDKPEVRHAGGVYYTPRWVVDTVVDRTLGPLVTGRTPRQVANLRILDPACGSGAFLLGAFDYLVRWHEEYYDGNPDENRAGHYVTATGERRLTSDTKATILANNVYGTDIDPQAVEVTHMSLYLAMLEQESSGTLSAQQRLFESAFLPRLDRNVRCGNSLLGSEDVDAGKLFDDAELSRRVNPFDWRDDMDGFGQVFSGRGGFDAVIGNPPYTRVQVLRQYRPEETSAYQGLYAAAAEGSFDIANLFVERGLSLLRPDGRLGYIITRGFCETTSGAPLRRLLSEGRHVSEIVDFGSGTVFEGASAYTLLLFARSKPSRSFRLTRPAGSPTAAALRSAETEGSALTATVPASTLGEAEWDLALPAETGLLARLVSAHRSLGDVCGNVVFQAPVTGADYVFRLRDLGPADDGTMRRVAHRTTGVEATIEAALLRPVLAGRTDIRRFSTADASECLLLPYARPAAGGSFRLLTEGELSAGYPQARAWLSAHRTVLEERSGARSDGGWWGFSRRQNLELFEAPKILVPYMVDELCAALDHGGTFFVNVSTGGYGIPSGGLDDPLFVTALLNSRLLSWVLRRYSRSFRGGWFAARKANLVRLPIVTADASARRDVVARYDRCVASRAAATAARSDVDRDRALRSHRSFVRAFDVAVEGLYGLSSDERDLLGSALASEPEG